MTESEEVTCWHLEYCSFDTGLMAWRPFIQIFATEDLCSQTVEAWKNVRHICLPRITGPHSHLAPRVAP